ncbi:MAG: YuzD family protein [Bacillota bacterium]|jgi:disulfide oxidoreductase YuzD|uniref:YuzD family protein n=1 Tax=Bacillus sp. RO2 TaxID=2723913 RepID=UPI00145ECB29|nr:YuzD family protein [Bacillus sp. RO2]MEA3320328.1 YuzD family protein [Bacillota bacterium]NMH75412.1 YuzD family protein [Bacillus sp. RO2]
MKKKVEICVYGAEVLCPSCVNLPSSKETYEWLEAAVARKYPNQEFSISYIDIYNTEDCDGEKREFAARVVEEDMFYPVVVIEGEIVGEGNPKLKTIYSEMEKYGYAAS